MIQDRRYVKGQAAAARGLRAMGPAAQRRIEEALDQGAEELRARAAAIAPRDTGELSGAIEVRETLDGFKGTGAVGNFAKLSASRAGGLARYVGVFPGKRGDPGWYAAWVEFGTKDTRARPFLLPSFVTLRKRIQGRINRAVNKAVREAAARGR